jgi:N,N'-diacetylchitobiose transport system substrate-binding protein
VKRKLLAVAAVTATIAAAAGCSSSKSNGGSNSSSGGSSSSSSSGGSGGSGSSMFSTDGAGKTIHIWLQTPPVQSVIDAVNAEFTKETGAKVVVDPQQWTNYTTKLTATFTGNNGIPDVVEIGNTDAPTYAEGGALMNITAAKGSFDNSSTWVDGLTKPCEDTSGNLYCIPYYGGDRVMIYRTDMFKKAGITSLPTSVDELTADCNKLEAAYASVKNFSCLYMPGEYWVAGGMFVYGAGGDFASYQNGKWQGDLESAASQKGLQAWKQFADNYSVGGRTINELSQDQVMAQGNVAMIMGSTWEEPTVSGPTSKQGNPALANKLSTFAVPGFTPGTTMTAFMGGSVLGVPQKAQNKGLAMTWLKILDSTKYQTQIAKLGPAIPNSNALMSAYAATGQAAQSAVEAIKNGSWATPAALLWAKVESANIPQQVFEKIANGTDTMAAAKWADQQMDQLLNSNS